jgi:hypothetical protein
MSPRRNNHERAQELLLEHNAGGLAKNDHVWLHSHLIGCAACSAKADAIGTTVEELRGVSRRITCSRMLARSAQMRVRERAAEMQLHRERMSPLVIACALACVWAIGAIPLSWHGFSSLAHTWQLPAMVWQVAAVIFALAPAALITAIGVAMRRERTEDR